MNETNGDENGSNSRVEHEREVLQADYEARRASMLKITLVMGVIVVLAILAMFVGIIALNGAIADVKTNSNAHHDCTNAKLDEILSGGHNLTPNGCPK